ncbi:hypothetical protein BDV95DRAFT_610131 [Massariosphaeria phaeospora]|uniref:Tafazzin n=1 Tax=Massariosphaeria phaeospora TaxID=100035 RepID=A0A7C8M577_9PLEO|nr:hypothetical protein BDV95DRAFT_610131 [Massariosphaeria phaeospora]
MPKKHAPAYTHTKPTYVSRPGASSAASAEPPTVNERIQQLRREQTPRATVERRNEVTEVVTHRTVPPELRRILHMAEVDAPPPKPGTRNRLLGRRPPPGPAAPGSWLQSSRYAPAKRAQGETGPARFCALARANDAEFKRLPPSRSLVHHCLRTFALHWEELSEYEQHHLPALPIPLKEALLSYLSLYGHRRSLDFRSFKIMFHAATGSEDIRFLDLTNLLNDGFAVGDLKKCLARPFRDTDVVTGLGNVSLGASKSSGKTPVEVADSWDDEAEEPTVTVPLTLRVPTFPNLTRLSLAYPGASGSWADLLTLSSSLKKLTHLSLAYWPRPSMTPNAVTASMVSKHSAPISLGGSHFYSDLDDDWHEAANILRRLSLNTYSLTWLDLEGCTWHKALTVSDVGQGSTAARRGRLDDWVQPITAPGPDWNTAWRQIEYINLFQGWIPGNRPALQSMPAGVVAVQLMRWLRDNKDESDMKAKVSSIDTGYVVAQWVDREKEARSVGASVQRLRKAAAGKWCAVDHGWG